MCTDQALHSQYGSASLHTCNPCLPHCRQGAASEWAPFLATLPRATLTPILWPDEERQQLLRGSPVLQVGLVGWLLSSALACAEAA